jgi:hypothetical protein
LRKPSQCLSLLTTQEMWTPPIEALKMWRHAGTFL